MTENSSASLNRYYQAVETMGMNPGNLCFYVKYLFQGIDLTGKTMLDVGAGDGRFSLYAACAGAREVVSLEPDAAGSSGGRTGAFERMASLVEHPSVKLVRSTVQEYRHDGEPFDVLLLHQSINHLNEDACISLHDDNAAQEAYLRIFGKLATLAKPKATLIVVDCARRNLFGDLGLTNPVAPTIDWEKHQAPELWGQSLMRSGFTKPKIRWNTFNPLRAPGRLLLGNRAAAYCLRSSFCLTTQRDASAVGPAVRSDGHGDEPAEARVSRPRSSGASHR